MRHRIPFDREAASFALQAQRDQAKLGGQLRNLQDGLAGLQRALSAPQPRGGSRYAKATKLGTASVLGRYGQTLAQDLLKNGTRSALSGAFVSGGSFYTSASQLAQQISGLGGDAGRIS